MADIQVYFGIPGNLLVLPNPRGGIKTTRTRNTQQFALGNGEYRTRRSLQGSRLYTLSYDALLWSTYASSFHAYDQGHMGPGPFVLLDPGQRNMLTVNQSSATSLINQTDNFTIGGSGQAIASTAAQVLTTPRSLAWTFNASSPASGTSILSLDSPYTGWPGIPVANRSHVFSAQVRSNGATPTVVGELVWYGTTGSVISTTTGTPVACSTSAWTALSVAASPPGGAAYVQPRIHYVSGAVFGSTIYTTALQLEEGTVASTWVPGTGIHPVTIVSLPESHPWTYPDQVRSDVDFVLRQDGR